MVACSLGDDYYQGAYFITQDMDSSCRGDYLVPRSQLERWEAARAAYEDMQSEIEQVMNEQRERIRAISAQRPKSPMAQAVEQVYVQRMDFALRMRPLPGRACDEEGRGL
jgi:hypothetical protein